MGLERTAVIMQQKNNVFETDIFEPIINFISSLAENSDEKAKRIIADHIRASVFIIADGITPSNTDRGYVLRRLLRRAIRYIDLLEMEEDSPVFIATEIIKFYKDVYPELLDKEEDIKKEIEAESLKFRKTLENGLKEFKKIETKNISGKEAFLLFSTYGFPLELTIELAKEKGMIVDKESFDQEMKKHQEVSKVGAEQKFKGGLASTGEKETKYHTATHLLLAALRNVLKAEIVQKGSNITAERMRFDFNWPEKVPPEKLKEVEDLVNKKIQENIDVEALEMSKEEAKKIVTTLSFDLSKYGDVVKVYKIENFSTEFCGGPHVKNTGELGKFKIVKEEASSAGIRRIKAVLE